MRVYVHVKSLTTGLKCASQLADFYSPCSGRVAILGVNDEGDEEPASPDFPQARPPAARPQAQGAQGAQGVRAGPGTLRHPNLDKIFTKWVAIKDLDAA